MQYQSWNDWKVRRVLAESKGQAPNYAFDNWLKMTKNFGDEVSSFVSQAREKDKELDDEIDKKKKEPELKEPDPEPLKDKKDDDAGDSEKKEKEAAWKKLREIAKERMKKDQKDSGSKQGSK